MDEYRAATASNVTTEDLRERDEKGRIALHLMSERELMEESVTSMRALADVLESIGQNPMLKAMMPKGMLGGK
jgi:hypothetical protein